MAKGKKNILPGFGLSFGYSTFYLGIIVIIPLAMLVFNAMGIGPEKFFSIIFSRRVVSSYLLSFSTAFVSASINVVFGLVTAWVIVRYEFPGRKIIDSIIDLPFALPTAVAGISLAYLFSAKGWVGGILEGAGIKIINTPAGIMIALIFIGFPFVVRTVQPVLREIDRETEEAAESLGAGRVNIFFRIILPNLIPALLTGFTLSFARSIGEYGSVIFISGNIPYKTEITPLLIMSKLDQFDYEGASSIAIALLIISFVLLAALNILQKFNAKKVKGA
jgi:sulfate transport system permease protein